MNLNPAMSGDGRRIVFESTEDLANAGGAESFRALQADIDGAAFSFRQMAASRTAIAAVSQDGSRVVWSALDNPLSENQDGNAEIFLFDESGLKQITNTTPGALTDRTRNGNFQPSISDDGRYIVFSSNRDFGANPDGNFEIVLYDAEARRFTQLTDTTGIIGATNAKISGDGSRIVFLRDRSRLPDAISTTRDLLVINRLTNTTRTLIQDASNLSLTPGRAVSDTGARIVFAADDEKQVQQVFLYDERLDAMRQLTNLATASDDVPLHATISGNGARILFATRRSVANSTAPSNSDRSVELYAYDVPTNRTQRITDAPTGAVAEVVSSLNDDGSRIAFNFPRILSGAVSNSALANNSEIHIAQLAPVVRGTTNLIVRNAATPEDETANVIAPDSIAIALGSNLAFNTIQAQRSPDGSFPTALGGTTVTVNNRPAQLFFVSPTRVDFHVPPETNLGTSEIVVTNTGGFETRGTITVLLAAPGIFTEDGTGRGNAVALDARTLQGAPFSAFDEFGNEQRIIVFATGARNAAQLTATIENQPVTPVTVEQIVASTDMPGLDQIFLRLPEGLRGGGTAMLTVGADGRDSNQTTLRFAGLTINEVLADPPGDATGDASGDANRDGVRSASQDEFIEFVNASNSDLDIGGYELLVNDGTTDVVRHIFAERTIVPAGTSIVVFGGARRETFNPAHEAFGGVRVVLASTGGLSLLNGGSVLTLRDASGKTVDQFAYGTSVNLDGNRNQSLTRAPDIRGGFALHASAPGSSGRLFSPGVRLDGTAFVAAPIIARIAIEPAAAMLAQGATQRFTARAFDAENRQLRGVLFAWSSSDPAIVTVDATGTATSLAPGSASITATARGVRSAPAAVTVPKPEPRITRVELSPVAATLNRGATQTFTARAFDRNNSEVPDARFTFASSNTLVASVGETSDGKTTVVRGEGFGNAILRATVDDGAGGTVTTEARITVQVPLIINEILADVPPDVPATSTIEGDANGDGARDADDDEFVELVNNSAVPLDISGVRLTDNSSTRFTFPAGTTLAAGNAAVVFGGGAPPVNTSQFGGTLIFTTGSLGLNDAGDTISLKLGTGDAETIIATQAYGTASTNNTTPAASDQSLTRAPDADARSTGGEFMPHNSATNAAGRVYSPGTRLDGTPFNSTPLTRIEVTPVQARLDVGGTQTFTARAFTRNENSAEVEVANVSFVWDVSDARRASIAPVIGTATTATATAAGTVTLRARAGSVEGTATITVNAPAVKPTLPAPGELVINEALVSFSSSSTSRRADFIELYNRTDRPLDISSLVISFRPSGSASTPQRVTLPGSPGSGTTVIDANSYFLIVNGRETFGANADFDASASGFDLNNTTGGIRIDLNNTKLDGLAYQGGNAAPPVAFNEFGEGGILRFTSGSTNDLTRQPNGADSNDNARDFRRNGTTANVTPRAANPTQ